MAAVRICLFVCFVLHLAVRETSAVSNNGTKSTTTQGATTPVIPNLGVMGKFPGGMESFIVPMIMKNLNKESLTHLMMDLAPRIPSLLRGMVHTNTTGMSEDERICYEDLETLMNETLVGKMWALKMMDAMGKPGPGIMKGATKIYGDFHECLDTVSEVSRVTGRTVRGDTCVVSMKPPSQLMSFSKDLPDGFAVFLNFEWHLCLPDTCHGQTIQDGLEDGLSKVNISLTSVACHSEFKFDPISHDAAAIGAIALVAMLAFEVLLGTMLDLHIRAVKGRKHKEPTTPQLQAVKLNEIYSKLNNDGAVPTANTLTNGHIKDGPDSSKTNGQVEADGKELTVKENGVSHQKVNGTSVDLNSVLKSCEKRTGTAPLWQRYLLCFSAISNGEKILSVKSTPGSLTCLNGIRVLSMGWVVLGHTFSFLVGIAENPSNAGDLIKTFPFQIIINGTLSVDSFFVLSGVLVTYLFLKETEKERGVKIKQMVMYYVHRYWRLTPTYVFMIFLETCLVLHLADSPTWHGPYDLEFCRKDWWLNVLYVNNLVDVGTQCFGVGWFLANDMQFYVFAPLALIPLALARRRGYGRYMKGLGLCVLAGFVITSIVTSAYFVYSTNGSIMNNGNDYMVKVYYRPWCRVGTFAIGVFVGYILHSTKCKLQLSGFVQGVGWLLALLAAGAATLATYAENGPDGSPWNAGGKAAHEALFRPAWALVLGWVIIMCCTGNGGIIDWMLSWSWWQPLARLTYGVFLIHTILMMSVDMGSVTRLIDYTVLNMIKHFFGYACISYLLAFILAILVEAPMLQLEKLVLSKK